MAGDWIKWTKGLAKKREVVLLASRLGRDRHEIAGRLMELWEWCDDNVGKDDLDDEQNVSLKIGDSPLQFIDTLLGIDGMAAHLLSPEVRWMVMENGSGVIVFPHLGRHNGTSAKTRAYEQAKKRMQRAKTPAKKLSRKCPRKTGTNPLFSSLSLFLSSSSVPECLRNEEFYELWVRWEKHRKEIGSPLKPTQSESQLKMLGGLGIEQATEMVEHTIEKGWIGLRAPEKPKHHNGQSAAIDFVEEMRRKGKLA